MQEIIKKFVEDINGLQVQEFKLDGRITDTYDITAEVYDTYIHIKVNKNGSTDFVFNETYAIFDFNFNTLLLDLEDEELLKVNDYIFNSYGEWFD